MKILLVEDEKEMLKTIAKGLKLEGYIVDTCENGKKACEMAYVETYDLIILDLNLPEMDGKQVLQKIRADNQNVKIIILSARIDVNDKIETLDNGANDYVTKPFDFLELEARIRNLLRRNFIQEKNILTFEKLQLNTQKKQLFIKEKPIKLTRKEIAILEYLMLNKGKVISQEELVEHVWDSSTDVFISSIRVHMSTLRRKLKAELLYDVIGTKIGFGYYLKESDETSK